MDPRWQRLDLQDDAWRSVLWRVGAAALLMHLLAAFLQRGIHHCDEYFQIQEYVGVLLGRVERSALAWEYGKQMRPWLQPVLYWLLVAPLHALGMDNPFQLALVMRLASAMVGWASSMALALCCAVWFQGEQRRNAVLVSLLTYLVPYVHARTSSENLAQSAFMFSVAALTLWGTPEGRRLRVPAGALLAAGALLGGAFAIRYQAAFLVVGLGLWGLWQLQRPVRSAALMAAGFFVSVTVAVAVDAVGYGEFVMAPLNYFRSNITEGGASNFGVSPWWAYVPLWFVELQSPLGPVVLLAGVYAMVRFPRHTLTMPSALFLVGHLLVGHKEARFLFPMLGAMLVLTGAALPPRFFTVRRSVAAAVGVMLAVVNGGLYVRSLFIQRPTQLPVLETLYDEAQPGEQLSSLKPDPLRYCHLRMNLYAPPGMHTQGVPSVDAALADGPGSVLLHREVRQVPVDDFSDARCVRLATTQPIYVPPSLAEEAWVKDAFRSHVRHELYRCSSLR